MTTNAIGIYVHIPFCVRKCNYCDFCSFSGLESSLRDRYVDRLCLEISSYAGRGISVDSIFFGGGTPSLLTPDQFRKICDVIGKSFEIIPGCEFTVEANPKTLDREKLEAFCSCGVNRLSIGLQSIHENELKKLGRIHNFEDFLDSYELARECGIDNINIDLMYGIPEQTVESFAKTLDTVTALSPEHLSVYGLILEEGTPFFEMKDSLPIPREDEECDMYYLAAHRLSALGYSHYEISNYASPGHECRNNLKYWRSQEYLGFGLAAYSYFDGHRFGNTEDMSLYMSEGDSRSYDEALDSEGEAYEYVMLRLRLREGFSLSDYKKRFGKDFLLGREELIKKLSAAGYLSISEDRLALTERGFYISNALLTELI